MNPAHAEQEWVTPCIITMKQGSFSSLNMQNLFLSEILLRCFSSSILCPFPATSFFLGSLIYFSLQYLLQSFHPLLFFCLQPHTQLWLRAINLSQHCLFCLAGPLQDHQAKVFLKHQPPTWDLSAGDTRNYKPGNFCMQGRPFLAELHPFLNTACGSSLPYQHSQLASMTVVEHYLSRDYLVSSSWTA